MERQRIDRWLWTARIVKTRTRAADLAAGGHIRVNREKIAKPSHAVRAGDIITLFWGGRVRILEVAGFVERRVGAQTAETLYVDHSPPAPARERGFQAGVADRPAGSGRPTKKARRALDRIRADATNKT